MVREVVGLLQRREKNPDKSCSVSSAKIFSFSKKKTHSCACIIHGVKCFWGLYFVRSLIVYASPLRGCWVWGDKVSKLPASHNSLITIPASFFVGSSILTLLITKYYATLCNFFVLLPLPDSMGILLSFSSFPFSRALPATLSRGSHSCPTPWGYLKHFFPGTDVVRGRRERNF